jgi:hypothetical protein
MHLRLRLSLLTLLSTGLAAQKPPKVEKVDAAKDPFTKNDPELLKKLGYVKLGQFVWLGETTTVQVQEILGDDTAIFIETAHFKIASTLRSFAWPTDKKKRDALNEELERLVALCPEFKNRPKTVTPWLRAHLYAHRLERLYAEFCTKLGIDESKFPKERGGKRGADYMGEGPYLGQAEKFLVVLAHKALSAGTYARSLHGQVASDTTRHNHIDAGCMSLVTASEFAEKQLFDDRKLHCVVVDQTARNLVNAYRGYFHMPPAWLVTGLGSWFGRRVDDEFLVFAGTDDTGSNTLKGHEFARRVRMRVDNDVWPKAEQLCAFPKEADLDFVGGMMAWSRVDFLMSLEGDKFGKFVARMKAPVTTEPRQPTDQEIVTHQWQAMQEACGWDPAQFDAAWVKYVQATYPKK